MHILALLTDGYGAGGGIAQYNRDLMGALASQSLVKGITLLPRYGKNKNIPNKIEQLDQCEGKIDYVLKSLYIAFRRKPDQIFCGHINALPLAWFISKLTRAPIWLQLHGIDAWQSSSRFTRYFVTQVNFVTCVSRFTRHKFLNWANIDPMKVKVLPNTVSNQYQERNSDELKNRWAFEGKKIILTVGRLSAMEQYKGHDRIIRALPEIIKKQENMLYLIAGAGDDRARLEALSEELNLTAHVKFLGKVPDEQLAELYCMSDLFAMPSTGEGFGIVFLEAMVSGTPALGLDVDGSVDPLQDGFLGIVSNEKNLSSCLLASLSEMTIKGEALAEKVDSIFGQEKFQKQVGVLLSNHLTTSC